MRRPLVWLLLVAIPVTIACGRLGPPVRRVPAHAESPQAEIPPNGETEEEEPK